MIAPENHLPTPNWDFEQLEVILDVPSAWQLVIAGPGAGKSAVACQRVASLVDDAVPPSRILLVSFTRTAVAEIRDRIVSYAVAGDRARSVRISTIDSHAWSLRVGFDDEPLQHVLGGGSYDLSVERTVELFRSKQPELMDFMARLEHLIIDEAQDVIGIRADLVLEILKSLGPTCGVTIFADPAQAIYGFTTEGDDETSPTRCLLDRLPTDCPRPISQRFLKNIHRTKDDLLINVFSSTRKVIERAQGAEGHVADVQKTIRETCGNDVGATKYENLAALLSRVAGGSMLVLFRWRADVLIASSYCSEAGVEHRLRMSDVPLLVRPWVGWLLGDVVRSFLSRQDFDKLWESRAAMSSSPFAGEERDASWSLLHSLAAGARPGTLDLVHLRNIVARSRPPVELCYAELGSQGPILGTIHASKGREADTVVLVMPPLGDAAPHKGNGTQSAAIFEEGRVYYVGATRARGLLATAGGLAARAGHLDSNRVYRQAGPTRAQLEVGRNGDVDRTAHLAWTNAFATQLVLAGAVGRTLPARARAIAEDDYAFRLTVEEKGADGITRASDIGQLSLSFRNELGKLWSRVDTDGKLRPAPVIPHLYVVAVGTIGLTEQERGAVKAPFNQSGMALAPVVKGFPMIQFLYRKSARFSR